MYEWLHWYIAALQQKMLDVCTGMKQIVDCKF